MSSKTDKIILCCFSLPAIFFVSYSIFRQTPDTQEQYKLPEHLEVQSLTIRPPDTIDGPTVQIRYNTIVMLKNDTWVIIRWINEEKGFTIEVKNKGQELQTFPERTRK